MKTGEPICPIMAMSASPSMGTERLLSMFGQVSCQISDLMGDVFDLVNFVLG